MSQRTWHQAASVGESSERRREKGKKGKGRKEGRKRKADGRAGKGEEKQL